MLNDFAEINSYTLMEIEHRYVLYTNKSISFQFKMHDNTQK